MAAYVGHVATGATCGRGNISLPYFNQRGVSVASSRVAQPKAKHNNISRCRVAYKLVISASARQDAQTSAAQPILDLPQRTWVWRGHKVRYVTAGCGEPIVLVHGFGASSGHWKRSIAVLSKQYKVYAIDLLGFGASDKPPLDYCMELWRDQVVNFLQEFVQQPAVLVGNSIGSLTCLMVNVDGPPGLVRGTVLLNCVGAMNNKGISNDWRIKAAYPLLLLIDLVLKTRPLASWLFNSFRTPDNLRNVLRKVYRNQAAVDDALVDLLYRPSCDTGALDVFVSVLTGPPGPKPWELMPRVQGPLLVMWGDNDPFVPADSPTARTFMQLPGSRPATRFALLPDVGHCPHDDRPDLVHAELLPWLQSLTGGAPQSECETAPTAPESAPGSSASVSS